jgi:hypothetical protein
MEPFRILLLVLASDTEPLYCQLQSIWKTASHPRADILFLKAHPNLRGDDFLHENTILIGCEESLDSVYEKQMRGFKVLLPHLKDYAFVFRTNLSSYVDIPAYLRYCETLPRREVYAGMVGDHYGVAFASGSGFTITPDLIERLVLENPPTVFLDDVSIGCAITKWGVPVRQASRLDYTLGGWIHRGPQTEDPPFHRRVKTESRSDDLQVLARLFEDRQSVGGDAPLDVQPPMVTLRLEV